MYGINIKNTAGHILISDSLKGLHYKGKAYLATTPRVISNTFLNYGTSLDGSVLAVYRITGLRGFPVVFVKPSDYSVKYANIHQEVVGTHGLENTWEFTILWSGQNVNTPPTLYIFSEYLDTPVPAGETHGIRAFSDTGVCTYDSRLTPLSVISSTLVSSPTYPAAGGLSAAERYESKSLYRSWAPSLDFDFNSNSSYTEYGITHPIPLTSIMFSCPSSGQAVYKRAKAAYYRSDGGYGSTSQYHSRSSTWAVMYLQAYQVTATSVRAGWTMYTAEYSNNTFVEGDGGFLGSVNSSGTSSSSVGMVPYSQKTINNDPNVLILSDSRLYVY